jgi:hypothetical protein
VEQVGKESYRFFRLFVEWIFAREMPLIDDSYDISIPFCDRITTRSFGPLLIHQASGWDECVGKDDQLLA